MFIIHLLYFIFSNFCPSFLFINKKIISWQNKTSLQHVPIKFFHVRNFAISFLFFIFPIREQFLFRWWFFLLLFLFLSVWWLFGVLIFIYFLFTVDKFNLNLTPLPDHRSCFINAIYVSVRFFSLKIIHIIVNIY